MLSPTGFTHCSSATTCHLSLTTLNFFFLLIHCPVPCSNHTHALPHYNSLSSFPSSHIIIPLLLSSFFIFCNAFHKLQLALTHFTQWGYLLCTSAWIHQIIGCRYSIYMTTTHTHTHTHTHIINATFIHSSSCFSIITLINRLSAENSSLFKGFSEVTLVCK